MGLMSPYRGWVSKEPPFCSVNDRKMGVVWIKVGVFQGKLMKTTPLVRFLDLPLHIGWSGVPRTSHLFTVVLLGQTHRIGMCGVVLMSLGHPTCSQGWRQLPKSGGAKL